MIMLSCSIELKAFGRGRVINESEVSFFGLSFTLPIRFAVCTILRDFMISLTFNITRVLTKYTKIKIYIVYRRKKIKIN